MPNSPHSIFTLPVLPAAALHVEHGANMGDALSIADDLILDDTYVLMPDHTPRRLSLIPQSQGRRLRGPFKSRKAAKRGNRDVRSVWTVA
ncbi:MAG: hypothetical protein R3D81_06125 [Thalassovita sp.]